MFVETETFQYIQKSLKLAQWLGTVPLIPRLLEERRVELNTSKRFRLFSWISWLSNINSMILATGLVLVTTYLKFVQGVLTYSFWVFWLTCSFVVFWNIVVDYSLRKRVGFLRYLINSSVHFIDLIEGRREYQIKKLTYTCRSNPV